MAALYQLAWEDTFGGTALDRAKWNVRIGNWSISEDGTPLAPGWGNNEQQYYRDDAQNLGYITAAKNMATPEYGVSQNGGYPLPRTVVLGLNVTF